MKTRSKLTRADWNEIALTAINLGMSDIVKSYVPISTGTWKRLIAELEDFSGGACDCGTCQQERPHRTSVVKLIDKMVAAGPQPWPAFVTRMAASHSCVQSNK